MRKSLYLVDVSSIFFRAFYAIPPLTNREGFPTNALYGFLTMSTKLLRENKPDYLAYCFDREDGSFRKELDPRYKANRSEVPDALGPQIPYVRTLSELLGVACFDIKGFEADDIIGALAIRGKQEGLQVTIVSGDKDFSQLVCDEITLYDTMKEIRYTPQEVLKKWHVLPERFVDYLALVGDSSDNVAGVRGIGPKSAEKLLQDFSSLEEIYSNLDKVAGAVRKKLEEGREEAFLSRKLVSIQTQMPLEVNLESLVPQPPRSEKLRELLEKFEFRSIERLIPDRRPAAHSESMVSSSPPVNSGPSSEAVASSVGLASSAPLSTSLSLASSALLASPLKDANRDELLLALSQDENRLGVLLLDKRVYDKQLNGKQTSDKQVYVYLKGECYRWALGPQDLGQALSGREVKFWGFDIKYFWRHLCESSDRKVWCEVDHSSWKIEFDLMLMAYVVLNENVSDESKIIHRLLPASRSGVSSTLTSLSAPSSPLGTFSNYLLLHEKLKIEIEKANLTHLLVEYELPLIPILFRMEESGTRLDLNVLRTQSLETETEIRRIEKEIFGLAGDQEFNIGSPKQLATILFDKLNLPRTKKTKTGWSTDSDVLEKLRKAHPICEKIIEYRELTKLKSTYIDALPLLVDNADRVHTHFNQALTATGRLSSSDPNLQNIPIRTERGASIRTAFVAREGCVLCSADYSQIELRILAHITEDPGLLRAFQLDQDIHSATASEVFGVPLEAVNADQRRAAKAVNFGIAYGQAAFGLSESLGISRKDAGDIITRYFDRFRRVKEYMDDVVIRARTQGYVETLNGRRRFIPELDSKLGSVRKSGERIAINSPIQGTASDIVKRAMILADAGLSSAHLILQVHDELVFEIPKGDAPDLAPKIMQVMESAANLKVPLKVSLGFGHNWQAAHS